MTWPLRRALRLCSFTLRIWTNTDLLHKNISQYASLGKNLVMTEFRILYLNVKCIDTCSAIFTRHDEFTSELRGLIA